MVLKLSRTGGSLVLAISAFVALPADAQSDRKSTLSRERDANQAASAVYQKNNGQGALPRPSRREQQNNGRLERSIAGDGDACTTDGLIRAEVNSDITKRVESVIHPLEKGVQVRDVAKLVLPCGFHIDGWFGWNLILTNGTDVRRYVENNPFGFAPAFEFGEKVAKPHTLQYGPVAKDELHPDDLCSGTNGHPSRPTALQRLWRRHVFFRNQG